MASINFYEAVSSATVVVVVVVDVVVVVAIFVCSFNRQVNRSNRVTGLAVVVVAAAG